MLSTHKRYIKLEKVGEDTLQPFGKYEMKFLEKSFTVSFSEYIKKRVLRECDFIFLRFQGNFYVICQKFSFIAR